MKRYTFFLIVTVFLTNAFGQHPGETQQEIGSGTRAAGLAGNHVALTAGIADLYWNPAALGFYVSREFQGSLYGFRQNSSSEFFKSNPVEDDIQRFKLSEAGLAFALPTSRGGLSIAASYSNPIILDDAYSFSGSYDLNDSAVSAERNFRTTGSLNFWTIGFGMQVAKDFSIGVAPSFINGKANSEIYYLKESSFNNSVYETFDDYAATGTYNGLDIRAGLFYRGGLFNIGARLVFPQIIRYIDDVSGYYDNAPFSATDRYTMYSSYKGAIGASVMLRPCTITAEIRGTLPYDYLFPEKNIPSHYQTSSYKTGAGIGIEAPVIVAPLLVRIGYSYDDLDLHPYVFDYASRYNDVLDIDWSDNGLKVNRDLHRLSTGIGYTASTFSYDLSYVFSTWGITTNKNLEQTYLMHRLQTTVSLRF